jgi:hypothetical protein
MCHGKSSRWRRISREGLPSERYNGLPFLAASASFVAHHISTPTGRQAVVAKKDVPCRRACHQIKLARLLARRPDGIFVAPFEQGEIGPDLFRAACGMG